MALSLPSDSSTSTLSPASHNMPFSSSPPCERTFSLAAPSPGPASDSGSETTTATQSEIMSSGSILKSYLASMPSSFQDSPVMFPEALTSAAGSPLVQSPEPLRGRGLESAAISSFQLPEAILAHRMSSTSLRQYTPPSSALPMGGAMYEAMRQSNNVGNGNLIRRLSNRASKAITRRRPSSAHPNSRDVSVGPGILRRRSDSNSTAPLPFDNITTERSLYDNESDYDMDDRDDGDSIATSTFDVITNTDGIITSGTSIVAGSSGSFGGSFGSSTTGPHVRPTVPLALLHGVPIRKVSSKKNSKRLVLTLDVDAGKITWGRTSASKCIYIDDIKEIRTAEDIRQHRLDCAIPESEESRFFSLLYTVPDTTQTKFMHLIADTDEMFRDWTTTLDAIYKHRQEMLASLMSFNSEALRSYWDQEMAKQAAAERQLSGSLAFATAASVALDPSSASGGGLDLAGIERVCRNIHIHVPRDVIRAKFAEADVFRAGRLNFSGFQEFVYLMKRREDVSAIYRTVASNTNLGLTRDEFLAFVCQSQGEDVDKDRASWEAIFTRFARRPKPSKGITIYHDGEFGLGTCAADEALRMTEAGLASFLTSPYNSVLSKEPKEYSSFDRPMNEYFISSSHNTYLLGRQVVGTSSIEGYIAALTRGCRCIEVDCWDGAGGPLVVHGNTFTTSISFRETISTINKYAFVKSQLPLWISLEVHCNPEQQRTMARIMREIFGGKLVTEPLAAAVGRLPTPSELKGRILIKTKKTHQTQPMYHMPLTMPSAPSTPSVQFASPATTDQNLPPIPSLSSPSSLSSLPPLTPFPPLPSFPQPSSSAAATTNDTTSTGGRRRGNSLPNRFQKLVFVDNAVQIINAATSLHSAQGSPVLSPSFVTSPLPKKSTSSRTRVNTITEEEVLQQHAPYEVPSCSASECGDSGSEKSAKVKQSKIVPELGCLAVYCLGIHKATSFDDSDCKLFNHILSWDETVFERNTKSREYRRAVNWHNMRYLMRVYPRAYRFGSSNFNPLIHWRRGVQMAALNWQTYDLGMQINAAMFASGTDQSGYVLKPRVAREVDLVPSAPGDAKPLELKRERKQVNFNVGVISAQQLMRPVTLPGRRTLDPYVEVELFLADDKRDRDEGAPPTKHLPSTPLLYRTKIVPENGFNPIFDQKFNFNFTTKYPELVFIRFSVKIAENGKYGNNTQPTATFTAKLASLKRGYRTIPLVDVNGDRYMFSTLFCEFSGEPLPEASAPTADDTPESVPKLKSIRTVFNRSSNMSPKSSFDSGQSLV